ncbi:peroxiredoxin [Desulfovibrio sp. OttesenSCG-928-O18]|nr:peroxiredoxin [Desulfovibrio sp. OttesenSCG-928-O18]
MIEIGKAFPEFSLPDQDDKVHKLADYAGKWLVVYFYPRDNTAGCSLEASSFAGMIERYATKGTAVVGVSADSVKSHAKFAEKLGLPFTLLSDTEHTLLESAGVWQKKKMAGKEYMGIVRSTYIVDPTGKVRASWTKVKVDGHAEAVLAKLHELQG